MVAIPKQTLFSRIICEIILEDSVLGLSLKSHQGVSSIRYDMLRNACPNSCFTDVFFFFKHSNLTTRE